MATNSKVKIRLQGHEKFPLREGWLSKGLLRVQDNPKVFQGKEGPDVFGIGNNMVKSLRYWLKAFNLITESPNNGATLSRLGEIICEYDPYIEDDFTVWILHSQIARNLYEATSWYMFFNRCEIEELSKETIEKILLREIRKYALDQTFSEKSVKADLDVILSMYGKKKGIVDPEDNSISPFSRLKLLKNIDGSYSKSQPDRNSINEWVVLYELSKKMDGKDSISIEQILNDECGLNKIYQLNAVVSSELLDCLDALGYIRVDRTAGLDMIYKTKDFNAEKVLLEYYENQR
ncbi:DUF4007 family protein [Pseudobutyrivibrio xylanivorans]|uniref:DUF4007 domain-containing protein n=1 Tax=Pseudobutyrivibrio xylanivorans DSM 14809 TaxID=1123012 RepID=A0A1M6JVK8_PSEXY|nr:DUF4007 family protein [Pseudobutyrivibrio xylanivorans]SHJ50727.1 Protein of unknown function [Pseudobutyrivibrio xylanivorans DSM 14809]